MGKYQRSPLTGNIDADVRVVGAGIAGMTTVYLLARARKSVVALDDGCILDKKNFSNRVEIPPYILERKAVS